MNDEQFCCLCGDDKHQILGHHLSYEKEEVIYMCKRCHIAIHSFAYLKNLGEDVFRKAEKWVLEYSHEWINGQAKWEKSERGIIRRREARKKHKARDREYYQKNKEAHNESVLDWQRRNPEKLKGYKLKYNKRKREERRQLSGLQL